VGACASNPCLHGGSCLNNAVDNTKFNCTCAPGWSGPLCFTPLNGCASNPCLNGGTCTNGTGQMSCQCLANYTGEYCQTLTCPAGRWATATTFPSGPANSLVFGTCDQGYVSPSPNGPVYICTAQGTMSTFSFPCVAILPPSCAAVTYDYANFPSAPYGTTATGTCVFGYQSASKPTSACSSTGVYSSTITNRCTSIKCASLGTQTVGGETVTFPSTTTSPGNRAVGTCPSGTTGSPYADCNLGGTWTSITGTCS